MVRGLLLHYKPLNQIQNTMISKIGMNKTISLLATISKKKIGKTKRYLLRKDEQNERIWFADNLHSGWYTYDKNLETIDCVRVLKK